METEIYIVTHKNVKMPVLEGYRPIQVGDAEDMGILRDNTADNISHKNSTYCELTAAYWIWKNSKADIVGLTHYRRFFGKHKFSNNINNIITKDDIRDYLEKYDIIIPKKLYIYNTCIAEHYKRYFQWKDYEICRGIIEEMYPDYRDAFYAISKDNAMYVGNMMICRKKIWDEYHHWLFSILEEIERKTDITGYDQYQRRVYGFLSERLLTVWIAKNRYYNIKELPVFNTEDFSIIEIIKNDIKKFVKKRCRIEK